MACPRCHTESDLVKTGWCASCERAYDGWVRQHAADIAWAAVSGGVVMLVVGMAVPLLMIGPLLGVAAAFAGFATIAGVQRGLQQRRRRQFLQGDALPRAYLPAPK